MVTSLDLELVMSHREGNQNWREEPNFVEFTMAAYSVIDRTKKYSTFTGGRPRQLRVKLTYL